MHSIQFKLHQFLRCGTCHSTAKLLCIASQKLSILHFALDCCKSIRSRHMQNQSKKLNFFTRIWSRALKNLHQFYVLHSCHSNQFERKIMQKNYTNLCWSIDARVEQKKVKREHLRQRWKMESQALMWERKAFPRPWPSDAPFTNPAMSTTFR